jgi:hypothetical protein
MLLARLKPVFGEKGHIEVGTDHSRFDAEPQRPSEHRRDVALRQPISSGCNSSPATVIRGPRMHLAPQYLSIVKGETDYLYWPGTCWSPLAHRWPLDIGSSH